MVSWPTTLGAPGIMGWYAFMPFMECYHGVWSMHHRLEGQLTWKGRTSAFRGGIGYGKRTGDIVSQRLDVDAVQHFETDRRISVMASVAHIPLAGQLIRRIYRWYPGGRSPDPVCLLYGSQAQGHHPG